METIRTGVPEDVQRHVDYASDSFVRAFNELYDAAEMYGAHPRPLDLPAMLGRHRGKGVNPRPVAATVPAAPRLTPYRYYKLKEIEASTSIPSTRLRRAFLAGELDGMRTSNGCNSPILIRGEQFDAWADKMGMKRTVLSPSDTADLNRRLL